MPVAKWTAFSAESANLAGTALDSRATGTTTFVADIDNGTERDHYASFWAAFGSITPAAGGSVTLSLRRKRGSAYPGKALTVKVGDANEQVRRLIAAIGDRRDVKGVAFLDPYKANLEWQTLQAIAATRSFEVLINLPLHMAINRLLKREDRNADWEAEIDKCFGTKEWRELIYPEKQDLFGDLVSSKADRVCELLLKLHSARLEALFGFVAPAKLIRNTRKSPLYFLLWAGPHAAGLTGARYILTDQPKLRSRRRS